MLHGNRTFLTRFTFNLCVLILIFAACSFDAVAVASKVRTWTGRDGTSVQATFVRMLPNGNVLLRRSTQLIPIPLSNFSDEDLYHLRHEEGLANIIPPTPKEPTASGERLWTDIAGGQLSAKFDRMSGKNIVLIRGGKELKFPFDGFSLEDQQFIRELMQAEGKGHLVPNEDGTMPDPPEPANPTEPNDDVTPTDPTNPSGQADDGLTTKCPVCNSPLDSTGICQKCMEEQTSKPAPPVFPTIMKPGTSTSSSSSSGQSTQTQSSSGSQSTGDETDGEWRKLKPPTIDFEAESSSDLHQYLRWLFALVVIFVVIFIVCKVMIK